MSRDDGRPPLDTLRARGEPFLEALAREGYEAHAGLKGEADFQSIYARHAAAYGDEALATALELLRGAVAGSEAHRAARLLTDWLVESRVGRVLAPVEEREIAWEGTAVIRLPDGREEPYARAPITIANTRDRRERNALDDARAAVAAAGHAPLRRDRLALEHEVVAGLALGEGYLGTWEALSGIALAPLRHQCEAFLRDTEELWRELRREFLKAGLGIATDDATRADALALMRAPQFDAWFTGEALFREVRRQVTEMGLSPDAEGRVVYDTGERPGKRARAFCSPVRIPDEVYLVLRPHGGQNDWTTFLHELGHALHFAYMDRGRPFEERWLGDNSVTEGYAMLFDHRMQDRRWLQRYAGLSGEALARCLRASAFEELQFLRRYCAKLLYELELHGDPGRWDAMPDRYVELLGAHTGFRYQAADAFLDVDPRLYCVRYLRAWQLQAVLAEALTERFDEDWWRNPRCGPFLRDELFAWGQRELADEQARRVDGRELSFAPVLAQLLRNVG